jgi:hypothetical protein
LEVGKGAIVMDAKMIVEESLFLTTSPQIKKVFTEGVKI